MYCLKPFGMNDVPFYKDHFAFNIHVYACFLGVLCCNHQSVVVTEVSCQIHQIPGYWKLSQPDCFPRSQTRQQHLIAKKQTYPKYIQLHTSTYFNFETNVDSDP